MRNAVPASLRQKERPMRNPTPRDLFNPPPQAGEVIGANGRHEPTQFVYDVYHGTRSGKFKLFVREENKTLQFAERYGMDKIDLNTALNIAAGGYRLTGLCVGCKGTGLDESRYGPCIVVGCISRTDEQVKRLATNGRCIDAIRLHRSLHDTGLIEAKLFIDKMRGC